MHQAHQTAPARTTHGHEALVPPQPGAAAAQRVVAPPQPVPVAEPAERRSPVLPRPAAASWRMARLTVEPGPRSVKAARDFTSQTLLNWGLPGLIDDAVVVVSELITNALSHGARGGQDADRSQPAELVLWCRGGHLVCVVVDASGRPPVQGPTGLAAEDGRGLHVIEALSARWGWTALEIGRKAVWAVIRDAAPRT